MHYSFSHAYQCPPAPYLWRLCWPLQPLFALQDVNDLATTFALVRLLAVAENFPCGDAKRPHVALVGELAMKQALGGIPLQKGRKWPLNDGDVQATGASDARKLPSTLMGHIPRCELR